MTPNNFEEFPFEKLSPSTTDIRHIILVVGMVEFFFIILHLLRGLKPSMESHLSSHDDEDNDHDVKQEEGKDVSVVRRGDADVVLRSLNLFTDDGGEDKSFDEDDELLGLFEEENPRLEEVKEAFDVFDEDRDGFIDAEELQKVLGALGFSEGLEVEKCKRMIFVVDENGDGRIDFDEFVRFMESSSC